MKKFIIILAMVFMLTACSTSKDDTENGENLIEETKNSENEGESMGLNQIEGFREGNIKAKMYTNMGEMEIILFPNVAPKAVENFVGHSKEGYYEGVTFHRVIEDFMIQGGDPTGTGAGGESIWGQDFEDEFDVNYRHFYGALSMANAGPSTNGSQFFIVTAKDNVSKNIASQMRELGENQGYPKDVVKAYEEIGGTYHLDGRHTVFGQVVGGMEVAENISKVKRDGNDKPLEDIVIEKVEIIE